MENLERDVKRKIEVEQERGDAERIAAKHLEARAHAQVQKKEALAHFKGIPYLDHKVSWQDKLLQQK